MSDAYQRVVVGRYGDGRNMVINKRTAAMLEVVEDRLGFNLTIVQGSYNSSTSASAGTHDGGGVVDLRTWNLTDTQRNQAAGVLRQVGFITWYRTQAQGFDPHFHIVAKGDAELSPDARDQVAAAAAGRNGLASNLYDGLNLNVPTFNYEQYLEEKAVAALETRVAVLEARVTENTDARAQYAYSAIKEGGSLENRVSVTEARVTPTTDARAQAAYASTHGGAVSQSLAGLESRGDTFSARIEALTTRLAGLESATASRDAQLTQALADLKAQVDALPKA